jgi:hypothetical protein
MRYRFKYEDGITRSTRSQVIIQLLFEFHNSKELNRLSMKISNKLFNGDHIDVVMVNVTQRRLLEEFEDTKGLIRIRISAFKIFVQKLIQYDRLSYMTYSL